MKVLALVIAVMMWICDANLLKIVKNDPDLHRLFQNVVRLIDGPTAGSIALVIVLAAVYLHVVLPNEIKPVNTNEIFVMGLSSGAVAVELWFANLLFWLIGREGD